MTRALGLGLLGGAYCLLGVLAGVLPAAYAWQFEGNATTLTVQREEQVRGIHTHTKLSTPAPPG